MKVLPYFICLFKTLRIKNVEYEVTCEECFIFITLQDMLLYKTDCSSEREREREQSQLPMVTESGTFD